MNSEQKNYIFYINWEDRFKNVHKIGYLAQIDEFYYLVTSNKENTESAIKNGYIGLPGFKQGEIYKSKELFNFFKNRILPEEQNKCEALIKSKALSFTDSFSIEQVSERLKDSVEKKILEMYEIQKRSDELGEK